MTFERIQLVPQDRDGAKTRKKKKLLKAAQSKQSPVGLGKGFVGSLRVQGDSLVWQGDRGEITLASVKSLDRLDQGGVWQWIKVTYTEEAKPEEALLRQIPDQEPSGEPGSAEKGQSEVSLYESTNDELLSCLAAAMGIEAGSEIGTEAQTVVDRLMRVRPIRAWIPEGEKRIHYEVTPESKHIDRRRVEAAIADHMRALGLEPLPVRWVTSEPPPADTNERMWADARAGFIAAWAERGDVGNPERGDPTSAPVRSLLREAEREVAYSGLTEATSAAIATENKLATDFALLAVAVQQARDEIETAVRLKDTVGQYAGVALFGVLGGLFRGASSEQIAEKEASAPSAGWKAAKAARWLAQSSVLKRAGRPTPATDRVARIYLPFVDAVEAGLWLCWVTPKTVIAVAAPGSSGAET